MHQLKKGDVIPDYAGFGKLVTTRVLALEQPNTLVFTGTRGKKHTPWTWALALSEHGDKQTKLQMRIRTGQLKHSRLLPMVGGAFDLAVAAGFEKGLNERLAENRDK